MANIEVAGNPWDVNLSGEVSLIPGASPSNSRPGEQTVVRCWPVSVTRTQRALRNNTNVIMCHGLAMAYRLHLDANGLQGGLGRVMFDMGADTGAVDIDNVAVFVGHVGAKAAELSYDESLDERRFRFNRRLER